MLETADARVARWLGIVSDLLCAPLAEVPYLRARDYLTWFGSGVSLVAALKV